MSGRPAGRARVGGRVGDPASNRLLFYIRTRWMMLWGMLESPGEHFWVNPTRILGLLGSGFRKETSARVPTLRAELFQRNLATSEI